MVARRLLPAFAVATFLVYAGCSSDEQPPPIGDGNDAQSDGVAQGNDASGDTTTGACGTCSQGMVCCEAPLGCAGQCVPDCRNGGSCPNGLSCNQSTGVCSPGAEDGGPLPDGAPPQDGGPRPVSAPPQDGGNDDRSHSKRMSTTS